MSIAIKPATSHRLIWGGAIAVAMIAGTAAIVGQGGDSAPPAAEQQGAASIQLAVNLAHTVRDGLKNPPSFELAQAGITPDGSVCLTYRATNSFGGVVTGRAVRPHVGHGYWMSDSGEAFVRQWNATCHDASDETSTVKHFM